MTIEQQILQIKTDPETVNFQQIIEFIEKNYQYNPARFINGIGTDQIINQAGSNEGSCKIFAFGLLNNLNENETLACFGTYYRNDVLNNPGNTDHTNIRLFIMYGWDGIKFDSPALTVIS